MSAGSERLRRIYHRLQGDQHGRNLDKGRQPLYCRNRRQFRLLRRGRARGRKPYHRTGVVVRFTYGREHASLIVRGTLSAVGTSADPIVFCQDPAGYAQEWEAYSAWADQR